MRALAWLWVAFMYVGVAVCTGMLGSRAAGAQPLEEIHDSGQSVPIAPYVSYLVAGPGQPGVMEGLAFPLRSRLSAGVFDLPGVEATVFPARWLVQPMFVLGTDRRSIQWLRFNREALRAQGAWGVVLDAPNARFFKLLQLEAEGIALAPNQSAWFEERLLQAGVNVYPVLIQTDGTVRQILNSQPNLQRLMQTQSGGTP
ncbi:integrating conjugative element protein [Variovorax sp. ZS18.2.2]|uniref:integrating conjugative element protein n=1 Tax=Variovorax sp. ZS18.2.2 TaxID=2971255 RepID=UPI0021517095|nr:integrating conjugative element protein [Variovorax sp. ZS18.2.2]MCR6480980.1 integrating conjugative element protein [Variovorax sp. ZS18.2.2]